MPRAKPVCYNAQQEKFVRMEAQGASRPEILKEIFGLDPLVDDEKKLHNADCQMSRWRKYPWYEETWKDEVRRLAFGMTGRAIRRINSQIDDENGWLANKASNDALAFGKQQIYGDDDKAISVQITGMPELGSPDQAEDDG